ncbi:MAG: hypothetical protein Q7T65_11095 [Thiobacillus sp.]|nr:hypothetical protein [Thiobacillus sp.]
MPAEQAGFMKPHKNPEHFPRSPVYVCEERIVFTAASAELEEADSPHQDLFTEVNT